MSASLALAAAVASPAQPLAVTHPQLPLRRFMTARSGDGKALARGEFAQTVQGDEVSMRLKYRFADGSVDNETTTYLQQGTFRVIRNQHIEEGPFFLKPSDLTVDAAGNTAVTRTPDGNRKMCWCGFRKCQNQRPSALSDSLAVMLPWLVQSSKEPASTDRSELLLEDLPRALACQSCSEHL